MLDNSRPVVLSVAAFTCLETIDGGDTIVVRFKAPDGREIALLVPQTVMADLKGRLLEAALELDPSPPEVRPSTP